ncbi:DUF1501 domain-containing protein [bacterium]|nr:DUF1501 domain-containing protein [bacterium]
MASRAEPTIKARCKHLIYLYMDGGPSQVDTFDYKPRLAVDHGKTIDFNLPGRFATKFVMNSPFKFQQHGESGAWVSEIFPNLSKCVDEICFIKSMYAKHMEHPSANIYMATGTVMRGHPSIGSWLTYGLGSESKDLPGYIVLTDKVEPQGGLNLFGQGFLSSSHRYSVMNFTRPQAMTDLTRQESTQELQVEKLKLLKKLSSFGSSQDPSAGTWESIIKNYELGFQLQSAVPDLLSLDGESVETRNLYGLGQPDTDQFGKRCLIARRLIEKGVRVVTLFPPTHPDGNRWDQHEALADLHRANARYVDQPIAGLLKDLRSRGLLDETLVVWGGEFGRTPTAELNNRTKPGREHNPFGFCMWLAGGGVKPGISYGATDEHGYRAVTQPVSVHDLHATILALFGIDHTRLTFRYDGRDQRLTDVYGKVVSDIIA